METKENLERKLSENRETNRKIKALIFDFGGVLNFSNDIVSWNNGFRALGAKNDISFITPISKTIIDDYVVGKYKSDEDFLIQLRQILDIPTNVSNEAVIAAWNNQIPGYNPELYKLMEYRKHFKLFGLSNTNKMHRDFFEGVLYPRYVEKYPEKSMPKQYRTLFNKIYCSHEIFCKKPNPEAWKIILKENPDLHPEECIFIDDIKEYVDAAKALGMHGFQFDIHKHSLDDVMRYVAEINAKADPVVIDTNAFKKFATEQDLNKLLAVLTAKKISYRLEDNSSENALEAMLESHQVTASDEKEIVSHQETTASQAKKRKQELKTTRRLLQETKVFKLFLLQTQGLANCFIFEPKSLSQNNEELLDASVIAFINFLKKQGFLQYCISQNQHDKSIKIIPILDTGNIVDINSKIVNSLRSFFGEQALVHFHALPSLDIFSAPRKDKRFDSLSYPSRSFWVKIEALAHNVNNSIMRFLIDNNIVRVNSSAKATAPAIATEALTTTPSPTFAATDFSNSKAVLNSKTTLQDGTEVGVAATRIQRNTLPCAFCIADVIRKQLILDLGHFLLLVNYQPYAGSKAHFLIVPKHIEDWSHLTEEQHHNLQKIITAVTKSIQANCDISKQDIISHVQNGVTAGQTVSGSHLHLMTKPKFLPFLIDIGYQMIGQRTISLTKEQMAAIALQFKPEILQSLWSECSPARLMITSPEDQDQCQDKGPMASSGSQMMLTAYSKYKRKNVDKDKNKGKDSNRCRL